MKISSKKDGEGMTDAQFEEYAKRFSDMVYRVAFGYLKNRHDSEDAMQNTLIRFYQHKDGFKDDEHLKAWLIRVASNESKRVLKANSKFRTVELETVSNTLYGDDSASRELFLDIMKLDEKYSTVIYLYYYEGYRAEEIAKLLRQNPSTVRTRLARARAMLKTDLEA